MQVSQVSVSHEDKNLADARFTVGGGTRDIDLGFGLEVCVGDV